MRKLQCGLGGTDEGSFIMSNLSTKYCLCSSVYHYVYLYLSLCIARSRSISVSVSMSRAI